MRLSMSGKKPELTFYERTSLEIGRLANGGPFAKKLQHLYHYHFSRNWVMEAVGRRVYVDNIEQVLNLHPDRGVIMAANHRSFYDQWISTLALFERGGLEFWGTKFTFRFVRISSTNVRSECWSTPRLVRGQCFHRSSATAARPNTPVRL